MEVRASMTESGSEVEVLKLDSGVVLVLSVALEMAGRVKLGFSSSLVGAGPVSGVPSPGVTGLYCQSGWSRRKILLCTPTCFAVLEPMYEASFVFEFGPYLERASTNRWCSWGVHRLLLPTSSVAACAARFSLAAAACWFLTCWLKERRFGNLASQNSHLSEPASSFLRVGVGGLPWIFV